VQTSDFCVDRVDELCEAVVSMSAGLAMAILELKVVVGDAARSKRHALQESRAFRSARAATP
jgi:hypothetical protein